MTGAGGPLLHAARALRRRAPLSLYDAQGLAFGVLLTSLGVTFLKAAGLVTGQTAGAAVLLSYLVPLEFGTLFVLISLPFFWLSWTRRGRGFALRTGAAVLGIATTTPLLGAAMRFEALPPLLAAALAGACCGVGLIALFRHGASAGGLGVLALLVEERWGLRAGWFQMGVDALVFAAALAALPAGAVIHSFVGAAVLNAVIAWNFRIEQTRPQAG